MLMLKALHPKVDIDSMSLEQEEENSPTFDWRDADFQGLEEHIIKCIEKVIKVGIISKNYME